MMPVLNGRNLAMFRYLEKTTARLVPVREIEEQFDIQSRAGGARLCALRDRLAEVGHPMALENVPRNGWRLVPRVGSVPHDEAVPREASLADCPPHRDYSYERMARAKMLVDLLPRRVLTLVSAIALESEENFEDCFYRLVSYGVEVHRDLVDHQRLNPLGLATPGRDRPGPAKGRPA